VLGEVIHGYRLEQGLASDKGGFGDVFFARHVHSGAEAVVKVLKPEMSARRDVVERFFNEARAAASVHHPGVVQIHNVGYHCDRAYLLMERLHGDDLETRLANGPLPVDRAMVFVRQTAGAMGAAHQCGVVHRDLKPANLFIVSDPDVAGGERVKVLDFGIAKLTFDAGRKTQGVFGTPAYMSPEQCSSTAAVDGRADLYSLGCIFYELVCGRPPFGHGGTELIASHLRDAPLPPRSLAPWLPPALEQVILRLLEKHPDRRYESCAALIAALDDAAVTSRLPAESVSQMPTVRGASLPSLTPVPMSMSMAMAMAMATPPMRSTLNLAVGAMTQPPARRSNGVWIGLCLVTVVGAGAAVLAATSGAKPTREPGIADGSGSNHKPRRDPATADGSGSAAIADGSGSAAIADGSSSATADAGVTVTAARVDAALDAGVTVTAARVDAALDSDNPGELPEAKVARLILAGAAAMRDNKHDDAEALLKQAYAIEARADALFYLCTNDLMRGRCRDALATCERVIRNWPRDPVAKVAAQTKLHIAPDSTSPWCYRAQ
jgi:serine/threonine-protein kinase